MKIESFPALSNPKATVLLLGTMPGAMSLALKEYYGHPRNYFWKLLATILEKIPSDNYAIKKEMLLQNQIAVWDVLQHCERQGSLDSAIINEVPNDFTTFLQQHPNIRLIAFNGQKAASFFKKHVELQQSYEFLTLSSTSPANASKSFEQKLEEWKKIRNYLNASSRNGL